MTNYLHSSFPFGSVHADGFFKDGKTYVVPGSFLEAFKIHRQTWHNYVKGKSLDSISVKVGKRLNVNATAYLVSDFTDFLGVQAKAGNDYCLVALQTSFQVDLEREIKQTNNIPVSNLEHSENREKVATIRLELLEKMLKGYKAGGEVMPWQLSKQGDLTEDERELLEYQAMLKDKKKVLTRKGLTETDIKYFQDEIAYIKAYIQKVQVRCSLS